MVPTISLARWKASWAMVFRLITFCLLVFTASNVRADLSAKQARKLLTRVPGFELKSSSVRVKSIAVSSAAAAEVSADVRSVFKFEQDTQGRWRVAEIRTGPSHWEEINFIATALKTQVATNECTAPDPPFRGAALIDPSVKRARCLLGSLLGAAVPSDAIRIQEVAPLGIPLASQPSALVIAWVRVEARLLSDKTGWHVSELRTGKGQWINLELIVSAVNEEKRKKARIELESMARALELFRAERGSYIVSDEQAVVIDHLHPRFLSRVVRVDPWHQPYKYQGDRDRFTLRSIGPDAEENTADDLEIASLAR